MTSSTCSSSSQILSPTSVEESEGDWLHCPLKGFDGCKDGFNGRGLVKASMATHLKERHLSTNERQTKCRGSISHDIEAYAAWEKVLSHMKMWLCSKCMLLHAWSKPCRHEGGVIAKPLNKQGSADFILHGIEKPTAVTSSGQCGSVVAEEVEVNTMSTGLTLDLLNSVFRKHIQTVSSIPPSCRLNFSRTLKATLDKVLLNPCDVSSWIQLLLLPSCTLKLYTPKGTKEERSGNRKKLQIASITQALLRWQEPNGCINMAHKLLEDSSQSHVVEKPSKRPKQESTNILACRKKISYGHYTAAIRVLNSGGIAPQNSDTMTELQNKHPFAPPPDIPATPVGVAPISVNSESVLGGLKSFPKGTSCGRDGLRAQHLLDALSGSAAAVADELLASITGVTNLWLAGICPSVLGEFVASAPLTPLLKPGGGIRPIAVGTIWRRLVSKLAASSVGKEMAAYLGDFQFGVGIPCGCEGILHSVNRMLEVKGHQSNMTMLLVDFSNAFNLVDRSVLIREVRSRCPAISKWVEFCYAKPARLYYRDSVLSSSQGVQQGDPLGPLLFALSLHPLVRKIDSRCKLDLHAWYLDDGTIIGDTSEVSKALSIIQSEGHLSGLHLNINKTEIFWPTSDPRSSVDGVFPADIGRPAIGVKLLGGPVSIDNQFCSNLVMDRVNKTIQLMFSLRKLKDPQSELLLLRSCARASRLYFSMRTTRPEAVVQAQSHFDSHLFQILRQLITGDGPGFGPLQQRLASLPIRDGGLGVYTMHDTSQYCFLASCAQTRTLQDTILRSACISGTSPIFQHALANYIEVCGSLPSDFSIVDTAPHLMRTLAVPLFEAVKKEMPSKYHMTERDSVLWQCNRTKHAQDYLMAIPICGLNQSIGPRQFSSVLCYRLGIPLFKEGDLCSCCKREMDAFGDHALHCSSGIGLKYRHDLVRDTFADMCFRSGVPARKEVALGFLSDTGSELRPADILVYNWDNGQDICFDVTGVSPFTGGGVRSFTPGHAISGAIDRKHTKYLDKCIIHGYGLGVLAFTTLGELGDETVTFLKRLKNCLASQDINLRVSNFLFYRIGAVIQKAVGTQIVARLPTIHLENVNDN